MSHAVSQPHLHRSWTGETTRFAVSSHEGYLITSRTSDGCLAELEIRTAKHGSTLAGVMDALSQSITLGLRTGAPLDAYVSEFVDMRFAPAGVTDDPELPVASSIVDYVARRLAMDHLAAAQRTRLGILTAAECDRQLRGSSARDL